MTTPPKSQEPFLCLPMTALPCPIYAVYGTRGALTATDEKVLKLRYLDMEKTVPAPEASREIPAMDSKFSYGNNLVWIEEEVPVAPASGATVNDIYKHIYLNIRENVPFPVKNEEAFEVARITAMIRENAGK